MNLQVEDHVILDETTWSVLVKLRAGYVCEVCGVQGRRERTTAYSRRGMLVAHHIAGDRYSGNHTLANGQALCQRCHRLAHKELARRLRFAT